MSQGLEEQQLEEQIGKTVWQGRIGDAPLRIDMLPSGRIAATWNIRGNERRAVVDTIEQLQQRVLFQLMLGAGPAQDAIALEVAAQDAIALEVARAIAAAQVDLPDPTQAPVVRRKKRTRRPGPPRSRRRRYPTPCPSQRKRRDLEVPALFALRREAAYGRCSAAVSAVNALSNPPPL